MDDVSVDNEARDPEGALGIRSLILDCLKIPANFAPVYFTSDVACVSDCDRTKTLDLRIENP
ncbi:hypothetical protein N7457_000970 [Penicillium paradoxum]|uniref:uncharacterized protein n=1 Tax=Penicillium paradoxum TaxID=176176 RepID=UPI0025480504|nr:uncharacterized protein N7457_000970 [Penicillium paradoxum]KAJ5794371.1 hypothetical protein N7457_000970 [Penicillium paradoxum]